MLPCEVLDIQVNLVCLKMRLDHSKTLLLLVESTCITTNTISSTVIFTHTKLLFNLISRTFSFTAEHPQTRVSQPWAQRQLSIASIQTRGGLVSRWSTPRSLDAKATLCSFYSNPRWWWVHHVNKHALRLGVTANIIVLLCVTCIQSETEFKLVLNQYNCIYFYLPFIRNKYNDSQELYDQLILV